MTTHRETNDNTPEQKTTFEQQQQQQRFPLTTLLDPVFYNERWTSSVLLLGSNPSIQERWQNPDHSHTRRNVLISNRSCYHNNQLSTAHVRTHQISTLGSVHRTPEEFENAAIFLRLGLQSTLIRNKNGAFRKRSWNMRNLKTPALNSGVDRNHFEMELFECFKHKSKMTCDCCLF